MIDDEVLSVSVNADGQITEFASDDSTYIAEYTGGTTCPMRTVPTAPSSR